MSTPIEALLSGILFALASWLPMNPEGEWVSSLVRSYHSFLVPAYLGVTFAVMFHYRERFSTLSLKAMRGIYEAELKYLFFATLFTVLIGFPLLECPIGITGKESAIVNVLIGMLIVLLALNTPKKNPLKELDKKLPEQPSILDALSGGVLQGFALLEGVTRTGIVTLGLLLPGHSGRKALEWGFLISPAYFVLRLLQLGNWESSGPAWIPFLAFLSAFLTTLLLIPLLEKLAERWEKPFLIAFGLIAIAYALEVMM
ncbi:undecaprenyl-diphosphate phosphatase [Thermococcus sp.]|uniref:undecaprenyl-diphosphate phosphatase n=1 Tax=Thermococcus sp. TaxID=35749 RepID=UPI0026388872|nr:undecaprenyl-diphosphate phosphatase [Thermococcus sp.]